MKKYLANTPLILQDENGEDVRVERGATVELSDTQYAEVAAHVTLIAGQPETPSENPPTSVEVVEETAQSEQMPSENQAEKQPETETEKMETAEKPNKRGGRTKESAA